MLGKTLPEEVLEEIGLDLERLSFSWDCAWVPSDRSAAGPDGHLRHGGSFSSTVPDDALTVNLNKSFLSIRPDLHFSKCKIPSQQPIGTPAASTKPA